MIEYLDPPKMLLAPPSPALAVNVRAHISCECSVWVGRRMDNGDVATMAVPCSPRHDQLIHHFNMLLAESTVEPGDELLVDVCERLLEEAERYSDY